MFRKSIGFFILVALLWVLLWVYLPDLTPDKHSFTDLLRAMPLVFAVMAMGFALLMLIIRFKGIDIVTAFFPQSGLVLWLGKHAYEYSQPKTQLLIHYQGPLPKNKISIIYNKQCQEMLVMRNKPESFKLGYLTSSPVIQWQNAQSNQQAHELELDIQSHLKRIGKNLHITVIIDHEVCRFTVNQ